MEAAVLHGSARDSRLQHGAVCLSGECALDGVDAVTHIERAPNDGCGDEEGVEHPE